MLMLWSVPGQLVVLARVISSKLNIKEIPPVTDVTVIEVRTG